jgi:hypothetical protein
MSGSKPRRAAIGALDRGRIVHELLLHTFVAFCLGRTASAVCRKKRKESKQFYAKTRSDVESYSRLQSSYCTHAQAPLPAHIFTFARDPLAAISFSRRLQPMRNSEINLLFEGVNADNKRA